jgi:hypothetical protein
VRQALVGRVGSCSDNPLCVLDVSGTLIPSAPKTPFGKMVAMGFGKEE